MEKSRLSKINDLIDSYFDALYYGDTEQFKRIMHPKVSLYSATGDELVYMDLQQYVNVVVSRPSPSSRGDERHDSIVSIDLASPTTAHVRVKDVYLPKNFTDELTLVQISGRWWIVSKVWHYE